MRYAVKRLGGEWHLTSCVGDDEESVMKRGDYPIRITYVVVDTDYPKYPLCFTDSESIAQNIAYTLNHPR